GARSGPSRTAVRSFRVGCEWQRNRGPILERPRKRPSNRPLGEFKLLQITVIQILIGLYEPAKEAAKMTVIDRGESPAAMEPLVLSEGSPHRRSLSDLAVELAAASSGFRRRLPAGIVGPLAELGGALACYDS